MWTKTKIAFAAALILGTASAAMASERDIAGGFVNLPSVDGVNPVFHPGYFPKAAYAANARKASAYARGSYAQARPTGAVRP